MQNKRYMIDTNVFISAFKSGYTTTTELLLKLLLDPEVELIVDDVLLKEYEKWFKILSTRLPRIREQAEHLYSLIKDKAKLERPSNDDVNRVKQYFPETESADIYHAATCLKAHCILITNDKDFQNLRRAKIVEIWTITEAVRKLLK
ncbi:Nucleotide binding protein, containing PIN domain [Ignicoccus islandicus DSM 13165]|uniref:Nucleotide binding protein, containing PIN domain n=1 Tax=Ignicoccus islandicus DSM 13165 TaxID=940295 RepID=A0A0U3FNC4_9CREN|nr:type II toxin-antitoxin system VapC family toxin [Ignicoccus islandicus]ALU11479.1 Nucleotide binding protein, containing PIN domain [Ignicoccus islandicus DSM 13165]